MDYGYCNNTFVHHCNKKYNLDNRPENKTKHILLLFFQDYINPNCKFWIFPKQFGPSPILFVPYFQTGKNIK